MEFLNTLDFSPIIDWMLGHAAIIVLGTIVFFQWVAMQALLIHYHFFRQSMTQKIPAEAKLASMESQLEFHRQQFDRMFQNLGEMKMDLNDLVKKESNKADQKPTVGESLEANLMTLGEINLKKRLEALKSRQN